MNLLNNILVTDVENPIVAHFEKGRRHQMKDRRTFGLSLCLNGQITYTMNGKAFISNKSNAVLLPQGGTYSLFGDREGYFPVINFKCENLNCSEITVLPLENPQACLKLFETIQSLFLHNESKLRIYSNFYELLSKVSVSNTQKHRLLQAAFQYIEKNISDPQLSNDELANKLGISEVYLRKLFLSNQKSTPKQHILDTRIRKAKQLLVDTPLTVTAISEECGFSSVYHFCRAFKQRTGLTPTQYAVNNKVFKI